MYRSAPASPLITSEAPLSLPTELLSQFAVYAAGHGWLIDWSIVCTFKFSCGRTVATSMRADITTPMDSLILYFFFIYPMSSTRLSARAIAFEQFGGDGENCIRMMNINKTFIFRVVGFYRRRIYWNNLRGWIAFAWIKYLICLNLKVIHVYFC